MQDSSNPLGAVNVTIQVAQKKEGGRRSKLSSYCIVLELTQKTKDKVMKFFPFLPMRLSLKPSTSLNCT